MRSVCLLLPLLCVAATSPSVGRWRRSVSCSIGGQRGCKWTCRLRGFLLGECEPVAGGPGTACNCRTVLSVSSVMDHLAAKLTRRYPDLGLLGDIMEDLADTTDNITGSTDGRWRPLPLLLALLYKQQERKEQAQVVEVGERLPTSEVDALAPVLAHYWRILDVAMETLRANLSEAVNVTAVVEENKRQLASSLGLSDSDVPWTWSSQQGTDNRSIRNHTADHLIILEHQNRRVLLVVLGTKVFPSPSMLDIIMDLAAHSEPFLEGRAHAGLAAGTKNLVKIAVPKVAAQLHANPGYSLLIIGYSLGAGLAQLLTLDLELGTSGGQLPSSTSITALCFGSPPVYTADPLPVLGNIVILQNTDDALSGGSLRNVKDVLLKAKAIESLNYRRRLMIKMVFMDEDPDDAIEVPSLAASQEKVGEGLEENKNMVTDTEDDTEDMWNQIDLALSNIPMEPELHLHHLGASLLVVRRQEEGAGQEEGQGKGLKEGQASRHLLTVIRYQGQKETDIFAKELRFSIGMFDDHMPWGYNSLFQGIGHLNNTQHEMKLDVLERMAGGTITASPPGLIVLSFLVYLMDIS